MLPYRENKSITISRKYLKGEGEDYYGPFYKIAPPANVPELEGYIMKIYYASLSDSKITINEMYNSLVFEKEVKVKGRRFKRYKYTEDELLLLYKKDESKNFEEKMRKRTDIFSKGPGRLVRASYGIYEDGCIKSREGWLIAPDADSKWAYSFDYDPLRDEGKHNKDAKNFSILEEYAVPDIAILVENKDRLQELLEALEDARDIYLTGVSYDPYFDKSGEKVYAKSFAEKIAFAAYDAVPQSIRSIPATRKGRYGLEHIWKETQEGEDLRLDLTKIATEIGVKCRAYVKEHRTERLACVAKEIKNLVGIEIDQNE